MFDRDNCLCMFTKSIEWFVFLSVIVFNNLASKDFQGRFLATGFIPSTKQHQLNWITTKLYWRVTPWIMDSSAWLTDQNSPNAWLTSSLWNTLLKVGKAWPHPLNTSQTPVQWITAICYTGVQWLWSSFGNFQLSISENGGQSCIWWILVSQPCRWIHYSGGHSPMTFSCYSTVLVMLGTRNKSCC